MANSVNATEAYPFTGVDLTSDKWSKTIPLFGKHPGVYDPLGLNTSLQVFADGTIGMAVKLRAGVGWLDSRYGEWTPATTNLDIGAAPGAGLVRIDRVVLRVNYSANTMLVAVVPGTPASAASAVPTALVNTGSPGTGIKETSLARVTVASGTVVMSSGLVTDERTFVRDEGTKVGAHLLWGGPPSTFPPGWEAVDGHAVNRVTCWELALVLDPAGTSATFPLLDKRGEALTGLDDMGTAAGAANRMTGLTAATVTAHPGQPQGVHTQSQGEMPAHLHGTVAHTHSVTVDPVPFTIAAMVSISEPGGDFSVKMSDLQNGTMVIDVPATTATTASAAPNTTSTGGGAAMDVTQPIGPLYLICAVRPR